MERHPVSSSSISAVGYDFDSSTLEIEFLNGGVYQYSRVPESVYQRLMSAASKGSYVADRIKDRYPYLRVE
jgi:uncharacterized protein